MRVLITLDGSPLAERALARLAPWVKAWQAEVWLLSVIDPRETHETVSGAARPALATSTLPGHLSPPRPTVVIDRGRALESVRLETEDALRQAAASCLSGIPVTVNAEFAEDPAEAINAFVRANSIDFVAMSTHGRSGLGQALLGSVAASVIRRAAVPIIVIGPDQE